jgi:hypothetical protein
LFSTGALQLQTMLSNHQFVVKVGPKVGAKQSYKILRQLSETQFCDKDLIAAKMVIHINHAPANNTGGGGACARSGSGDVGSVGFIAVKQAEDLIEKHCKMPDFRKGGNSGSSGLDKIATAALTEGLNAIAAAVAGSVPGTPQGTAGGGGGTDGNGGPVAERVKTPRANQTLAMAQLQAAEAEIVYAQASKINADTRAAAAKASTLLAERKLTSEATASANDRAFKKARLDADDKRHRDKQVERKEDRAEREKVRKEDQDERTADRSARAQKDDQQHAMMMMLLGALTKKTDG